MKNTCWSRALGLFLLEEGVDVGSRITSWIDEGVVRLLVQYKTCPRRSVSGGSTKGVVLAWRTSCVELASVTG